MKIIKNDGVGTTLGAEINKINENFDELDTKTQGLEQSVQYVESGIEDFESTVNNTVTNFQNTVNNSLTQITAEKQVFESEAQEIKNAVENMSAAKIYSTLADAIAESPKPENGTPFSVMGDDDNDGYYKFDSTEATGVKFGRKFDRRIQIESISQLRQYKGKRGEAVDVLGYYESGDGGGGLFYWDEVSTENENEGTIIQNTGEAIGRWKRRIDGAVNVKWFGAKGDGVTDDTAAIQNAINSLSGKGTVFVPKGNYKITSSLTVPSGVTIKGEGKTSSVIIVEFNGAGVNMSGSFGSYKSIQNLGFDSDNFQGVYKAITVDHHQRIVVSNIYINNPGIGIELTGRVYYLHAYSISIMNAANKGVSIKSTSGFNNNNLFIIDNILGTDISDSVGVDIEGAGNKVLEGSIEHFYTAIKLNGSANVLDNIWVEACSIGIEAISGRNRVNCWFAPDGFKHIIHDGAVVNENNFGISGDVFYQPEINLEGLYAYYKFDELEGNKVIDYSGNVRDALLSGNVTRSNTDSLWGKHVNFLSDGMLTIPDSALPATEFTFLLRWKQTANDNSSPVLFAIKTTEGDVFKILIPTEASYASFYHNANYNAYATHISDNNKWSYFVFHYNYSTGKLTVTDPAVPLIERDFYILDTTGGLEYISLGSPQKGVNFQFSASMLMIFDRKLSQHEILNILNFKTSINADNRFDMLTFEKLATDSNESGTTLGAVVKKIPAYDSGGILIGYLPIYDTIN